MLEPKTDIKSFINSNYTRYQAFGKYAEFNDVEVFLSEYREFIDYSELANKYKNLKERYRELEEPIKLLYLRYKGE
jgi:asparagine synthetase A